MNRNYTEQEKMTLIVNQHKIQFKYITLYSNSVINLKSNGALQTRSNNLQGNWKGTYRSTYCFFLFFSRRNGTYYKYGK